MGVLTQHMYKAPVPILALVPAPEIPPALDAIIQKCLTKRVDGRYPSMGALLADLEKLEHGDTPDALGEMMVRSGAFNVPADYFRTGAMPALVPARPAGVPRGGRMPLFAAMGALATLLVALAVTFMRPRPIKAEEVAARAPAALASASPTAPLPALEVSAPSGSQSAAPAASPSTTAAPAASPSTTAAPARAAATTSIEARPTPAAPRHSAPRPPDDMMRSLGPSFEEGPRTSPARGAPQAAVKHDAL
jgi:serine/threonine-protein kinase